ncbi:MAG: hypothetical protein ABI175_28815 [Polyangiales bacterium]
MSVVAAVTSSTNGVAPRQATVTRLPTPFPSREALALEQTPRAGLERVFANGVMPDLERLVGWEFRGINRLPFNSLPLGKMVGIKKFMKGFYRGENGRVMGYNCPVEMNALDGRWIAKPSDSAPKRFGFYEAYEVDATARDNEYLHSILLDYGKGDNPRFDITSGLRDYVVQVDPANPDLLLGKAYYAIGPARIGGLNFFILERHRRGLTDFARR